MKKRNNIILLTLFAIVLHSISANAQKQSFTENGVTFFVKSRSYFSKQLADSLNKVSKKKIELKSLNPKDTNVVVFDNILDIADYDIRSLKYFRINPKNYVYFVIKNLKDSITNDSYFTNIVKIDRDSLSNTIFNINEFTFSDFSYKEKYKNFNKDFKLVKTNNNKKKLIAGFNCYEVIFESESRILQMYVTEEIKLNYHPEINDEEILKKYYPLYIKMMSKEYPNHSFNESYFFKKK